MRIRNLKVTPVRSNRKFSGLGQSADCVSLSQQVSNKQAELASKMSNPAYAGQIPQLQSEFSKLTVQMNEACSKKEESGSSAFKDFTQGLTSLLTAAAPAAAQIYSADQAAKAQKAAAKAAAQSPMFPGTPIVVSAPSSGNNTGLIVAGVLGAAALVTVGLLMSRSKPTPAARRKLKRKRRS